MRRLGTPTTLFIKARFAKVAIDGSEFDRDVDTALAAEIDGIGSIDAVLEDHPGDKPETFVGVKVCGPFSFIGPRFPPRPKIFGQRINTRGRDAKAMGEPPDLGRDLTRIATAADRLPDLFAGRSGPV